MLSTREFLPPAFVRKFPEEAAAPAGFDYPVTAAGTAGNVNVYYATSLASPGEALENSLLGVVAGPYSDMETFFGVLVARSRSSSHR